MIFASGFHQKRFKRHPPKKNEPPLSTLTLTLLISNICWLSSWCFLLSGITCIPYFLSLPSGVNEVFVYQSSVYRSFSAEDGSMTVEQAEGGMTVEQAECIMKAVAAAKRFEKATMKQQAAERQWKEQQDRQIEITAQQSLHTIVKPALHSCPLAPTDSLRMMKSSS